MRRDGVFRSVPSAATQEAADKVVAQFGAWSAIVALGGGELCQAFFDSQEAANAALEGAMQSTGKAPAKGLKNAGGVATFVAAGAGPAGAQRTVSPPASGAATKAEGTPEPGTSEQQQQQQTKKQPQQKQNQTQGQQKQQQQEGGKQQQQPPSREQTPGGVGQGVKKESSPQQQQKQQQKQKQQQPAAVLPPVP
jgi:hypothetical protein